MFTVVPALEVYHGPGSCKAHPLGKPEIAQFRILSPGFPFQAFLIYFQEHLGFQAISCLFLLNILGYPGNAQTRLFVFNDLLGYPFIFDMCFRSYSRLQTVLGTDLFSVS